MFLVMGAALTVLMLWSVVTTPRVIRRTGPRVWLWWACWLCLSAIASQALIREGLQAMGWAR